MHIILYLMIPEKLQNNHITCNNNYNIIFNDSRKLQNNHITCNNNYNIIFNDSRKLQNNHITCNNYNITQPCYNNNITNFIIILE